MRYDDSGDPDLEMSNLSQSNLSKSNLSGSDLSESTLSVELKSPSFLKKLGVKMLRIVDWVVTLPVNIILNSVLSYKINNFNKRSTFKLPLSVPWRSGAIEKVFDWYQLKKKISQNTKDKPKEVKQENFDGLQKHDPHGDKIKTSLMQNQPRQNNVKSHPCKTTVTESRTL